jgi:hypothetical protein
MREEGSDSQRIGRPGERKQMNRRGELQQSHVDEPSNPL